MSQKFDARQTISRDTLDQMATSANTELDNLLRSINNELTPPLKMHQDTGSNRVLKIETFTITNPETSINRSIPPINNLFPTNTFPISITFAAAPGGTNTVVNSSISSGATLPSPWTSTHYIKVGINIDATGNLSITYGTSGATVAAATAPATIDSMYPIGYVVLQNSAGTISNVQNTNVYQYVGAGGTGGGSGDTTGILETYKNVFSASTYNLLSPAIAKTDQSTVLDGASTAAYSIVDKSYKYTSAGQTIISYDLIDSSEFYTSGRDIWNIKALANWKSTGIDTAATYEISRDGGSHYYPIIMSRIGSATEAYQGDYKWLREEEDASAFTQATGGTDFGFGNGPTAHTARFVAKVTLSATRLTKLGFYLKKSGTSVVGNYRFIVYNDNAGTPGTQLYATGWADQTALTTSYVFTEISVDGLYNDVLTGDYWLGIETSTTGGTDGIQADHVATGGSNSAAWSNSTVSSGAWTLYATSRVKYLITGATESFASVASAYGLPGTVTLTTSQASFAPFTFTKPTKLKQINVDTTKVGSAAGNYRIIAKDVSGNTIGISSWQAVATATSSRVSMTFFNQPSIVVQLYIEGDSTYNASYSVGVNYMTASTNTVQPYGRALDLRLKVTSSAGSKYLDGFGVLYDQETFGVASGTKKINQFRFQSSANTSSFQLSFVPDPDLLTVYHVESGLSFKFGAFSLQGGLIVFPANTFYNGGIDTPVTLIATQNEGASFDNSDRNGLLLANSHLGSTDSSIDKSIAGRGVFLRSPNGTLYEITINDAGAIAVYTV